jgi:hypothetical protein
MRHRLFRFTATRASAVSSRPWLACTSSCLQPTLSNLRGQGIKTSRRRRLLRYLRLWLRRRLNVLISFVSMRRRRAFVSSLFVQPVLDLTITFMLGMRGVKHLLSNADNQIQEYNKKFADLRATFEGHAILDVEISVLRILDDVEDLSELCGSHCSANF